MGITYFKRYRMEFDTTRVAISDPCLPAHYSLVPWSDDLIEPHAEVKYQSFRFELDANVFASLAEYDGCLRLMREIAGRSTFVAPATWLIAHRPPDARDIEFVGTIQGLTQEPGVGAVQNVGVTPEHRGLGLGSALLMASIAGFQSSGARRVALEVTAQNSGAVRLYQRLGFRRVRTLYKAADVAFA